MDKASNENLINIKTDKYLATQEERLVLFVAQWIVNDYRQPEIERILARGSVNWEDFNVMLEHHELSSFAYTCLKRHSSFIPDREIELLKKKHYIVIASLARLEKEFLEIADIFCTQGVDIVPIKGTSFLIDSMYGAKTGLRPMADIDVLVKRDNFTLAEKLAETLGYHKVLCGLKESYWREKNYHAIFSKMKNDAVFSVLEIHWFLDYPRKILLLPLLWERIKRLKTGDREITLLSPEDTLFSLALHLRRFGNVLSLKSACDFACLLTKYKDLDWDYILREAKNGQMCASLYFRLIQANILFDIRVPNSILNGLNLLNYKQRLIENFILKNTFLGIPEASGNIFLKNHFLVYDNFREPVSMVINMPQEQFAKFYSLDPYSVKTLLFYRLRFLYFSYYLFKQILKAILRKIVKR